MVLVSNRWAGSVISFRKKGSFDDFMSDSLGSRAKGWTGKNATQKASICGLHACTCVCYPSSCVTQMLTKNFEISSLCGIEPLPTKTGKQLNISLIWNQNKTLWRHIECFLSHFCRSTSKDFTASCYLFCNISLRGLWIKWGLFYPACGNRIVNLSSIKIQTLISWVQSWCEMVFWIENRIFF